MKRRLTRAEISRYLADELADKLLDTQRDAWTPHRSIHADAAFQRGGSWARVAKARVFAEGED